MGVERRVITLEVVNLSLYRHEETQINVNMSKNRMTRTKTTECHLDLT